MDKKEMSRQLMENMGRIIEELVKIITNTSDVVITQLPIVCQEIILYGQVTNLVWVGIGLVMYLVSLSLFCVAWVTYKNADIKCQIEDTIAVEIVVGVSIGAIGSMFVLSNLSQLVMVYFAPKLYLLKYLKALIN